MMDGAGKYVLVDRDGTVIVNKHYQKDPALTELLPNAREGLDRLRAAGYKLVLITNQSGIGRGLLTRTDLAAVNKSVLDRLHGGDNYFEAIYYCPHVDADGCNCRKPRPGLVNLAEAELGFSASDAYVIGDKECDMELGQAVGATTILVRTGDGAKAEAAGTATPAFIADDLLAAAEWIILRDEFERVCAVFGSATRPQTEKPTPTPRIEGGNE